MAKMNPDLNQAFCDITKNLTCPVNANLSCKNYFLLDTLNPWTF